jgi:Rrf2 family protein
MKFLEQILLDLKRGGFVESRRGKVGGYLLARPPSEIKVGEVIRFIDGPIEPIACLGEHYSGCRDVYRCVFRPIWKEVDRAMAGIIDNITFAELIKRSQVKRGAIVYQI